VNGSLEQASKIVHDLAMVISGQPGNTLLEFQAFHLVYIA